MSKKTAKTEDVSAFMDKVHKKFGKGSFFKVSDEPIQNIERTSSGSIALDDALGGGYPKGRIIEIYGGESSGKTSLVMHAIAEIQKSGGRVAFLDVEHALDLSYASRLGVVVDDMYLSQPDEGAERLLELVEEIIDSELFDAIVVDSVAALSPKKEIEGEMGDSVMGVMARLMSQALRKLTSKAASKKCTLFFINQTRDKIGVVFGNPQTTTGGNALKFYASQRLELRKTSLIKEGEEVIGHNLKVKVVKNKVAPPFREANIKMIHGVGVSRLDEVLDMGILKGIIKKSGSWYSYEGTNIGQGSNGFIKTMEDNPELYDELINKISQNE